MYDLCHWCLCPKTLMFIREQVEALGKNLLSAEIMKIVQRWFHRLSWSFMLPWLTTGWGEVSSVTKNSADSTLLRLRSHCRWTTDSQTEDGMLQKPYVELYRHWNHCFFPVNKLLMHFQPHASPLFSILMVNHSLISLYVQILFFLKHRCEDKI